MRRAARVLLVEDSAVAARATANMLAGGGVLGAVVIAETSDEAEAELRTGPVDLLVLDLSLPDRQGLDLLSEVRSTAAWSHLPVVVLSGGSDAADVLRTYELGADCFVHKPQRVDELFGAVRAIEQFWARRQGEATDGSVFQFPLAATAESVREARATVRRLLVGWGMSELSETAELCTSELATNAVIHAQSPVLLSASRSRSGVRIEVQDEDPRAPSAGALEGPGETGRGLAIVDALSACWGVEQQPGGKTVWFELHDDQPVPG